MTNDFLVESGFHQSFALNYLYLVAVGKLMVDIQMTLLNLCLHMLSSLIKWYMWRKTFELNSLEVHRTNTLYRVYV